MDSKAHKEREKESKKVREQKKEKDTNLQQLGRRGPYRRWCTKRW